MRRLSTLAEPATIEKSYVMGVARTLHSTDVDLRLEASMLRRLAALSLPLALAACHQNSFTGGPGSPDMGVTPGGSQDIGVARDLIAQGVVPSHGQFTAEGLFSEHDLPIDGPPCAALLCPRAAATIHRPVEGEAKAMVQLGFASNVDPATFRRPHLDVALLVDTSGSMDGDWLAVSKRAMIDAVAQLGPNDRASLTEFGSRARVLQRGVVTDEAGRKKLTDEISALSTNGVTDMESGMRTALGEIKAEGGRSGRLMIFTDMLPNTGLTEDSDFLRLVREHAARGVGVTYIGVNPWMGSELATTLSKVRGANFFYLDEDSRERLFVDEFDFMVTPVAYDMAATLTSLVDAPVDPEVYGAPVDGGEVKLGASTLFFSKRRGGIAALFPVVPDGPTQLGTFQVSYVPVGATAPVTSAVTARWEGGAFLDEADGLGVYRLDVLVQQFKAMSAAADVCAGERLAVDAIAIVDETAARLRARSEAIEDGALAREATLLEKLSENLAVDPVRCDQGW
jgi:Ca-activated chloride channel homolog